MKPVILPPLTLDQQELVLSVSNWVEHWALKWSGPLDRQFNGRNDLVQEVWVGVMRAAANYDPSRGVEFGAFAYRCVMHRMWALLKKSRKTWMVWCEDPELTDRINHERVGKTQLLPDHRGEVEWYTFRGWFDPEFVRLRQEHLSWRERIVLALRCVEGKPYAETGAMVGCTKQRILQIVQHAVDKLTRAITSEQPVSTRVG
jgi:RNA polymerase sigma factor (sigma-70 family)